MAISESIRQMEKAVGWKPWAEKGWTLHQAHDGRVRAVNVALGMATERWHHIKTLISRLERGAYGYKEFLDFKKSRRP